MKINFVILCSLGLLVNYCKTQSLRDRQKDESQSLYCRDLNPQNQLDMEQIMGMWYGSEIITHHDIIEGETLKDVCITIHLKEITQQMTTIRPPQRGGYGEDNYNRQSSYYNSDIPRYASQNFYHHLRLIWDEFGTAIDYTLRYNTSRPGFWLSSEPQRGTMIKINYSQFAGTVQVMKAVGDHMVLTFCEGLPSSKLFSIVLSRRPGTLTYDDIQGVRSLLKRRGMSIKSVRKVCKNGTVSLSVSASLVILAFVLTSFWNKNELN